nr:CPBP family glutamic-type intramembrane protease [Streptococcus macedonicus]
MASEFFWGGIVALINEELFYRDVLMSTYFKHSRYHLDILVSAICFASVHVIWSSWSCSFSIFQRGFLLD